jgi:hypothetical protein
LTAWVSVKIQRQHSNIFLPLPLCLHRPHPTPVRRRWFLPELKTLFLLPPPDPPLPSLPRHPLPLRLTICFMTLKTLIIKPSAVPCTGPKEPRVALISLPSSARQNNVRAYCRLAIIKTSAMKLHHHYPRVRIPTRHQTRLRDDTVKGPRLHPLGIPCQAPLRQPCRKASYRSPLRPPVHPAALSEYHPPAQVMTTGV